MKQRSILREIIFYAIVIALIVIALSALFSGGEKQVKKNYGDVVSYIENEQIKEFTVTSGHVVKLVLTDGTTVSVKLGEYYALLLNTYSEELGRQRASGQLEVLDLQPPSNNTAWLSYLPMILLIVAMVVIWIFSFRALNGKNSKFSSFGRAKPKTATLDF